MFELTNRDDERNRKKVQYLPVGIKPTRVDDSEYLQSMTTMERIEVTIRDIDFDMNYLGASYLNAVARAEDYNKTVSGRKKMFKTCHKLRFCGKTFKKDEYRLAHNSINAYDGLLDSNKEFGYGDYMKSLLQVMVGSSSEKSSKSSIVRAKVGTRTIDKEANEKA